MKIFCSKCIFYDPQYVNTGTVGNCTYIENITSHKSPDTWLYPGRTIKGFIKRPSDINTLNQCTWYKENKE